jgi:hypothetical protein
MKRLFLLSLIWWLQGSQSPAAQVFYGRSPDPNSYLPVPDGGIAMIAGGNVSLPSEAPATADGSVRLVQSALGFVAAVPQGHPTSYQDLVSSTRAQVFNGTKYRYRINPDGSFSTNPPTEKNDGTFTIVAAGNGKNYDEMALIAATDAWRVAIRTAPLSPEPYRGLVQVYWERLLAETALASQDYVDSVRFRLLPGSNEAYPVVDPGAAGSAMARQRDALLSARLRLDKALSLFAELARSPLEGPYLLPEAPFALWSAPNPGSSTLPTEASGLFETFVRVLALATEVDEQVQRLNYLQRYGNPLTGNGPPASGDGSAAAIRLRAGIYEDYTVLMGAYAHLESYRYAPISRAKSGIALLLSLAADVEMNRVSFAPGIRQGDASTDFVQTSFAPYYVPFLTTGVPGVNNGRTFDNLLALSIGSISASPPAGALGDALAEEAEAKAAAEEAIDSEQVLKDRSAETLIRYNGQLIELCGSIPGPNGTPVPDLQGYLFSPDLRLEFTGRSGTGAVLAQYKRIEQARTRYEAAVQDLSDLYREVDITEQAAAEKAGIARSTGQSIAHVFTTKGDAFALLDKTAAEIQALTARQVALAQAEVQKRGWQRKLWDGVRTTAIIAGSVAATVATAGAAAPTIGAAAAATLVSTAYVTGGIQFAGLALDEIENWGEYNKQGKAILASAELQAVTITNMSEEVTQKQIKLRAAESADVALVSADGQVRQIEAEAKEQIKKLYVRLERLQLNILLAEQEVNLAELELRNLFDRVGYLLEEYQEAIRVLADLPLNRPDIRYVRNYRMGVAEDSFRRAQMWIYLTLKSAQYRFMTTGTFNRAGDLIAATLKCRNATELKDKVVNVAGGLKDMGPAFYLGNGFAAAGGTKNLVVSVRDQIYQENLVERSIDGSDNDPFASYLPVAGAVSQDPSVASDAQWLQILQGRIRGLAEDKPVLTLSFSTSFDPRGNNPLHNDLKDQLGHVILSASGRKGIFVNLRGSGLPLRNYSIQLEQLGATYLTYRARSNNAAWEGTLFPVRTWTLPGRFASITAIINKDTNINSPNNAFIDNVVPQISGFDERSPYCDQWLLTIDGSTRLSPNYRLLMQDLTKLKDIQIGMTVEGFDPQRTTP